jgi:D-hexose-6-phosphate mutarotase
VTLHGEQLRTDFRVLNTSDKPFDFTTALHTYFEVLHVDKAKVRFVAFVTFVLDRPTCCKSLW